MTEELKSYSPGLFYVLPVSRTYAGEDGQEKVRAVEGRIVLKRPTVMERMEYLEKSGFEISEEGQVKCVTGKVKSALKMVEHSVPFYAEVSLVREDGSKLTSIEELLRADDCSDVLYWVAGIIMSGFKPGKP